MRVECFVLGGQAYKKDGSLKTFLQLVTLREGRSVSGYDMLGGVVLDGDRLEEFSPMQQVYYADVQIQRFGDQQRLRVVSLSK